MPSRVRYLRMGDVVHVVGTVVLGVAAALLVTGGVGVALGDGSGPPLLLSAGIAALGGWLARRSTHVPESINYQEAFATVTFGWIAVAAAGALPYLFSGTLPSPTAAFFESVSGFTTTGSTVLRDIEVVAPGILLWRSTTQWLGGMGFIVLGVAVLPYLGVGGMQLFRLEAPGPTADRLRPRIRETARLLWVVYAALTAVLVLLYLFGGMSVLEAINHAFTTMPTGGFSTRNASLAAFSPYVQWVAILFMYLAGTSFTLHYRALGRGPRAYWRDAEWRLYTGIILVASLAVALMIRPDGGSAGDVIRHAVFQVVSVTTTTGYATADYVLWVPAAQIALFLLFFLGGMAGSTGGGMKMIRVLLVLEHAWLEIRKQLHPRAVFVAKVSGRVVQEHVVLNVLGFVLLYMLLFGLGTFALALFDLSLPAAAGAAATAISNVGPALGELGPTAHFAGLPWGAQLVLSFLMIVGRLEIYTVLLLLHPGLWRR